MTASYTVTVTEDRNLLGTLIASDSAEFGGNKISCSNLYIGRTYNEYDMAKLVKALYALRDSQMQGKDLLTAYSRISFSLNNVISHNADGVANAVFVDTSLENSEKYTATLVPGLYGGTEIGASHISRFVGEPTSQISIEDIFPGDVLIVLPDADDLTSARMFVTDGTKLFDITGKTVEVAVDSVLSGISQNDYFALLRPSLKSSSETCYRSQPFYEGKTDVERAIIVTTEAFLLRGDRTQYADTRLVTSETIYRWERGKSPEDYTVGEIGYTNCTGFTHDVYLNALGWDYGSFMQNSNMRVFEYTPTGNETDDEKAQFEAYYRAALKVGDIIYYSYSGNNHAMLYIGNGNLVHATGSVYADFTETEEAAVRYQTLDSMFTPGNSRYFFQTDTPRTKIYIFRPLNDWSGSIPEEATNRINNMQGVVAEKISSHTLGQTVNHGDLISYTFKIFNSNAYSVVLDIIDTVPEGTVLVIDGVESAEQNLSWNVEIAPGEEIRVSYMVKVLESAEYGSAIIGSDNSTVGGVPTRMTPIFVGRTLTAEEQELLVATVNGMMNGEDTSVALANKIYKEVLGVDNMFGTDITDLRSQVFPVSGSLRKIADSGKFAEMIAPTLYGGKKVDNSTRFLGERTRMMWERNLIVGDVLYLQGTADGYGFLYIYVGEGKFVNMQSFKIHDAYERLEDALGWQQFVILRPSLAITD